MIYLPGSREEARPTGYAAVARAADRAAAERGPDPTDPRDPCPKLLHDLDVFVDDPITVDAGLSLEEFGGLIVRSHVRRHGCQGMGEPW